MLARAIRQQKERTTNEKEKVKPPQFADNMILCMATFDKGKYQISDDTDMAKLPSREMISEVISIGLVLC